MGGTRRRYALPDLASFQQHLQELEAMFSGIGETPSAIAQTSAVVRRIKGLTFDDVQFGPKTLIAAAESCFASPARAVYLAESLVEREKAHAERIRRLTPRPEVPEKPRTWSPPSRAPEREDVFGRPVRA